MTYSSSVRPSSGINREASNFGTTGHRMDRTEPSAWTECTLCEWEDPMFSTIDMGPHVQSAANSEGISPASNVLLDPSGIPSSFELGRY